MPFDRLFGISKRTFLETRIQPANPNDTLYNDRCPFCWDEYHDRHPSARILPCNHVFGLECIRQMVDGPTGHLCPLCRSTLFRASWLMMLSKILHWMGLRLVSFALRVYTLFKRIEATFPRTYTALCTLVSICSYNAYEYAKHLLHGFTGFSARNPDVNIASPCAALHTIRGILYYLRSLGTIRTQPTAIYSSIFAATTLFTIVLGFVTGSHSLRKIGSWRDRFLFGGTLFASFLLSHGGGIWTMWCYYMDFDPLWLAMMTELDYQFFGHMAVAIFLTILLPITGG